MKYEKEYNKIPLPLLMNVGLPTSFAWLNNDQQRLFEWIFDEYYDEIHKELEECQEEIGECCE
jgi:hypothetical protein